MIFLEKKNIEK